MRNIVLPEVRLERPVIFLEQGSDGRRNWLLDRKQEDEGARIRIDRLTLNHGLIGYDDAAQKTHIRAELTTANNAAAGAGISFTAQGQYKGLPLKAQGKGGPVLGLRDETTAYPLQAEFTVGHTTVKADGSITSLLKFSVANMQLAVRGDSLAQLFPLLGMAFPETRAYATAGHLLHRANIWRYEEFSGRIGGSDIAGTLQVNTGGKISKLMMEKAGLHLWEILELKLAGDQLVKLRCAVAGFDVKQGSMHADALIFDTEVTTIVGTGSINLAEEKLDLTLSQKTKYTSPLALRSPIYVRGSFARPVVEVDKGRVAARALGAIALGLVNPLLTLIPLIDAGP